MAEIDLFIHVGDEQIMGGAIGQKPSSAYPVPLGQAIGHGLLMEELGRIEPSDSTGTTGGQYAPYYDGTTFNITSNGTPTTTTIGLSTAAWGTNEWAGREIEFLTGAHTGEKVRVVSNTATLITFTPALGSAPASGDQFRIKGGFVKFYHAKATSASGITLPALAAQPNSKGDTWGDGSESVTPTAIWVKYLVQQYGYTGNGFRMIKYANTAGTAGWASGGGGYPLLQTQVQLAIDQETSRGNTLKVRAFVIDAVTRDVFGLNLAYEGDCQKAIDGMRNLAADLGITDDPVGYTATASTTTTLTVSGAGWDVDELAGKTIRIDAGAQSGQLRLVMSNTADTITIFTSATYAAFSSAPGAVAFSVLESPLVVIASPKIGCGTSLTPPNPILSNAARLANVTIAGRTENVRTLDYESAEFATAVQGDPIAADRYYDIPSYLRIGLSIHNAIQAFYTVQPTAAPGSPIPCIVMIGTSQMVTIGINQGIVSLMLQRSFLGEPSLTIMPGGWIWDDLNEVVAPYDVTINASTFGTSAPGGFGPECTALRDLIRDKWPNGVVIFKYAKGGVALTQEAGINLVAGYVEPGGAIWSEIVAQFSKFRQACIRDLNRSPDVVHGHFDLGENDLATAETTAALISKMPGFVDTFRQVFTTRVDPNWVIPVSWQQPPPSSSDVAGGSNLASAAMRNQARDAVVALPTRVDRLEYIPNRGPIDFELQRADLVHYGGEAVLKLGYAIAAKIIEMSVEGEEQVVEPPAPETATFVVESGSGLTDANSYASVEFAHTYWLNRGAPTDWIDAEESDQQDALRRATSYLDDTYGPRWRGSIATTTQALHWPRAFACDGDTRLPYDLDEIPRRLREATCELAIRLIRGTSLRPDISAGGTNLTNETVTVGPITIASSYMGVATTQPKFPEVEQKVRGLLGLVGGSMVAVSR